MRTRAHAQMQQQRVDGCEAQSPVRPHFAAEAEIDALKARLQAEVERSRKFERDANANARRVTALTHENESLAAETRTLTAQKEKMAELCRALQEENRRVKEQSEATRKEMLEVRAGGRAGGAAELAALPRSLPTAHSFRCQLSPLCCAQTTDRTLAGVSAKIDEFMGDQRKLAAENEALTVRNAWLGSVPFMHAGAPRQPAPGAFLDVPRSLAGAVCCPGQGDGVDAAAARGSAEGRGAREAAGAG